MTEHRLCYVDGAFAYFTSKPLVDQWGDDWNDAPYEHNAGIPYSDEPGQIIRVAWEGPFEEPSYGHTNSPWSVEQINAGAVAWLRTSGWAQRTVRIMAGTLLDDFADLVEQAGGTVYFARQPVGSSIPSS